MGLPDYDFILGMPWLRPFNPDICWQSNSLRLHTRSRRGPITLHHQRPIPVPDSMVLFATQVLRLDSFVIVYLDDILIYSRYLATHKAHLHQVLQTLRRHQLFAKESKCELFRNSVEFLGHHISGNDTAPTSTKIQAVSEWPVSIKLKEIQIFLGFTNFLRRYVKDYSQIVAPLTSLIHKVSPFLWTPTKQAAFLAFPGSPRQIRWQAEFPDYDFTVHYLSGKDDVSADALSSCPGFHLGAITQLLPATALLNEIRAAYSSDAL